MPFFDQITLRQPLDFFDNFGNCVEMWLHCEGLGKKIVVSPSGMVKWQESVIKTADIFFSILKGISYLLLLPFTLGCLVYREVRRSSHLLPLIHGIRQSALDNSEAADAHEVNSNNDEPKQSPRSDEQLSTKKHRDYEVKDYCLVRIGGQRFWIRSHEDEKKVLKELHALLCHQTTPVQMNLILGEAEHFLGRLMKSFRWSHPMGAKGRLQRNVCLVEKYL